MEFPQVLATDGDDDDGDDDDDDDDDVDDRTSEASPAEIVSQCRDMVRYISRAKGE